jgi:hypothetical protein
MINIHYAFQSCDVKSFQGQKRFCGDDRTLLSKKSIKSFLSSVKYCAHNNPHTTHHIAIFDDHSTQELKSYHKKCQKEFQTDNIIIELIDLIDEQGISTSIRRCYEWLSNHGKDLVYQVQDDYLFLPTAIYEMVDIFVQLNDGLKSHPIIVSYNHPYIWGESYKYQSTPRLVVSGLKRYWIQLYEIPCTFLTSKEEFSKHWDLYEKFLNGDPHDSKLERDSIFKIVNDRKVWCVQPIESIALHMQAEIDKDPYIDWKSRWDSISLISK